MKRLVILGLGLLLAPPVLAQPLPERVAIGDGHMTVGFELKTTDKGSGPNGRTSSHALMDYIIPEPGASWSEAERAEVARWGSMSPWSTSSPSSSATRPRFCDPASRRPTISAPSS